MDLKITSDGLLEILRGTTWEPQYCKPGGMLPHGHWVDQCNVKCQFFSFVQKNPAQPPTGIKLCQGVELDGTITDERPSP